MSLHAYAENIRYHVEEILELLDPTTLESLVECLKKYTCEKIEANVYLKHKQILEYIQKTPKQRTKLEKIYSDDDVYEIRIFSLYELQKVSLFIKKLDEFLLQSPTPYREFAVHTSKFLQEISCDDVLYALEETIDDFKRSKAFVPVLLDIR